MAELVITEVDRIRAQAQARLLLAHAETHTFRSFVGRARKGYVWYRHCAIIANVLERVASGELRNVMFLMPPRHSKTETVCRMFGAYYLHKFPGRWVGLTSYSDELAHTTARAARRAYIHAGGDLLTKGDKMWETPDGGGMWSAGAGGAITGKGFHLGIIDDIFKNLDEYMSEAIRSRRIDWYTSTWFDRREPNAAEIIVNTRWGDKDLVGTLFEEEKTNPRRWHVVCLEALKEEVPLEVPATCTMEPDWRATHEALCPERFSVEDLELIKATQKKFFITKYQQRPTITEGEIWKRAWFPTEKVFNLADVWKPEDEGPAPERGLETVEEEVERKARTKMKIKLSRIGYDWDCAYTEEDKNSASAYVLAGVDRLGAVYVLDVGFRWFEFSDLVAWMTELGGPNYVEQKASGKSVAQVLRKNKLHAVEVPVKGPDKVSRAELATPAAAAGMVYVASHIYTTLLDDPRQGILNFPSGMHDDLNDAFVQAINRLWNRTVGPRFGVAGKQ